MAAAILTTGGKSHELSAESAATARELLGRKRSGVFAADSAEATKLLALLDIFSGGAGDEFTLAFKGRTTVLRFEVGEEGLRFETVALTQEIKPGTVRALKAECRDRKVAGTLSGSYSKLNKCGLQTALETGVCPAVVVKPGTVDALRAECKARGLKGYSKLRKADLIALLSQGQKLAA